MNIESIIIDIKPKHSLVLKVCIDPQCEAVWHNCPKNETKCKDCGVHTMEINHKTYLKRYAANFIQYDFQTYEYYRPKPAVEQIKLKL